MENEDFFSNRVWKNRSVGMTEERYELIKTKYDLSSSDMARLTLDLPVILPQCQRKVLIENVYELHRKISDVLETLSAIQEENEEVLSTLFPHVDIAAFRRAKGNIEGSLIDIGPRKLTSKDKKFFSESGNEDFLVAASSLKRCVHTRNGLITFQLKEGKSFSYKMEYVHELCTLFFYWSEKKGRVKFTNPESRMPNNDGECFFSFCSDVLGFDGLTPLSVYQKFKDNFKVAYNEE
ncbi:hypothetical protein ACP3VW_05910 [Vibrio sp. DNB22_17_1]